MARYVFSSLLADTGAAALTAFMAETVMATGADLPQFLKDGFDAFLACGVLAHGLPRRPLPVSDAAISSRATTATI